MVTLQFIIAHIKNCDVSLLFRSRDGKDQNRPTFLFDPFDRFPHSIFEFALENNIANLIANFFSSLLGANNCVRRVIIKFLLALMLKDDVLYH